MAKPKILTQNGHDFFEISSLLQKAIRRGHAVYAGYAACELMVRYRQYLWKRLLICSAEDCYDCVTKEIVALKQADDWNNNPIFIARAITLLLRARKNRDADWFCCNLLNSRQVLDLEVCKQKFDKIPDYTYDCHTYIGKMRGKTKEDMIRDEQAALYPHQKGEYDDYRWDRYLWLCENGFYDANMQRPPLPSKEQMKDIEDGCIQEELF